MITQISNAKALFLFDYLYVSEAKAIHKADVIIGFGHFDLKIPRHCGCLYSRELSDRIIFAGGKGPGSADLKKAEARAFLDELRRTYPGIPRKAVILEDRSTNTPENIQFTMQKLEKSVPNFTFGKEISRVILVANAYRQRRVLLTCKKNLPDIEFTNAPPDTTFEEESGLFSSKRFDFKKILFEEVERIDKYMKKGDIAREEIPVEILQIIQRGKGKT